MRSILGMAAIVVTACASHPTAIQADAAPRQVKVDATNVVEVQQAGYTIVNKNGQKLYCTKERQTGSHIQTTTTCLTEQEWQVAREANQRAVESMQSQLPRQGH